MDRARCVDHVVKKPLTHRITARKRSRAAMEFSRASGKRRDGYGGREGSDMSEGRSRFFACTHRSSASAAEEICSLGSLPQFI